MQSIDISNLNLKEIQYINGEQFENLLKNLLLMNYLNFGAY